jgi:O-antigen/teichoic acid export membrane protein
MSVSTVMTPILTTLDRFVIGAMLSVSMVAYYATPVDMLMKLQVFSSALMGVVFPAFAATYLSNTQRTVELFSKSLLLIGAVMFAVALSALTLGQLGLTIWLGESFAEQSKWVLYWAALGLFANALSFVPFALLQAIDRADITAKTNLFEMPVYFAFLYWALCEWGIVGAAIASTLRLVMNSLLLFGFSAWLYPAVRKQTQVSIVLMLFGLAFLLVLMGKMDY